MVDKEELKTERRAMVPIRSDLLVQIQDMCNGKLSVEHWIEFAVRDHLFKASAEQTLSRRRNPKEDKTMDEVLTCGVCGSSSTWIIGTSGIRCTCGEWPDMRVHDGSIQEYNERTEPKDYCYR